MKPIKRNSQYHRLLVKKKLPDLQQIHELLSAPLAKNFHEPEISSEHYYKHGPLQY